MEDAIANVQSKLSSFDTKLFVIFQALISSKSEWVVSTVSTTNSSDIATNLVNNSTSTLISPSYISPSHLSGQVKLLASSQLNENASLPIEHNGSDYTPMHSHMELVPTIEGLDTKIIPIIGAGPNSGTGL